MTDLDPHHRRVRSQYDRQARWYDRIWSTYVRRSLDPFVEWIDPGPEEQILEIGAGTGELARRLLNRVPDGRVTGVDLSPGMLTQARSKYAGDDRVRFVEAGGRELPFANESFDRVVTASTLHYEPRPLETFEEVRRVLRPSGAFDLLDWSAEFWVMRVLDRFLRRFDAAHHRVYRCDELVEFLRAAGLEPVRFDRFRAGTVWQFLVMEGRPA